MLIPHSNDWYDRLALKQQGYYYPWHSKLLPFNGEDIYLELVRQQLTPESDVLEIACGHGEVALELAPRCRTILAYDRVSSYIELAQTAVNEKGIQNVTFVCADSTAAANQGHPRLPAESGRFDLLISRRGPLHWIADARRVARPGAVLIQLMPISTVLPPWNEELPGIFRFKSYPYDGMYEHVKERLAAAGLRFHSTWTFERPEIFGDVEQFYRKLSWGFDSTEVPSFGEIQSRLESLFAQYAGAEGLAVPHGRFLWISVVD